MAPDGDLELAHFFIDNCNVASLKRVCDEQDFNCLSFLAAAGDPRALLYFKAIGVGPDAWS